MSHEDEIKREALAIVKRHLRVQVDELLDYAEFVQFSHSVSAAVNRVETTVVATASNGERIELRLVRDQAQATP